MKHLTCIIIVAVLMDLWMPLASGLTEKQLGTPPRVVVSLLLLEAPSTVEMTTDLSSIGTIIAHQSQLTPGRKVYLEIWCQTPGPNGISTAVIDLEYDTSIFNTSIQQLDLSPQWDLLQFEAMVDDVVGVVDDFGGNNLDGLGSEPDWAKVGAIEFDITSTPSDAISFCSRFAEGFLKFAIKAEGNVDPGDVSYGCFLAGCDAAVDCNDGNRCTDDLCDAVLGCVYVNNTAPCDDGEICTNNDTCADGICFGGSSPDCDDENICTTDSCDLAIGCVNTPAVDGTPCADDVFCDGEETCQDGVCTDEADPCSDLAHCDEGIDTCLECVISEECDDGNPCTFGVCVVGGTCTFFSNNDPCSDDNACTENDICAGGICVGGTPLECNDGNECTENICDAIAGCQNPPSPAGNICGDPNNTECDDPDTCDGKGNCLVNNELNGPAPDGFCDDSNECTINECLDGTCVWPAQPVDTLCGDLIDTECDDPDTCDGVGTCLDNHAPDGMGCTDDENECTNDVCGTGACTHPNMAEGSPCGDPSDTACDGSDTCDGIGMCLNNYVFADTVCGDSVDDNCTDPDTCDGAGICLDNHAPLDTLCGIPINDCTSLTCDGAGTCGIVNLPSGTLCGNPSDTECDSSDTCDGSGICKLNYVPLGTPCLDELYCNGEEICNGAGICQKGDNPCKNSTLQFCNESTDKCVECLKISDANGDRNVDLQDFAKFNECDTGPVGPMDPPAYPQECRCLDVNDDGDIDLADFAGFLMNFSE